MQNHAILTYINIYVKLNKTKYMEPKNTFYCLACRDYKYGEILSNNSSNRIVLLTWRCLDCCHVTEEVTTPKQYKLRK